MVFFLHPVIGYAKADGVERSIFLQSSGGVYCRLIGVFIAVAAAPVGRRAVVGRLAVRQRDDVFIGNVLNSIILQLFICSSIETALEVGAAISVEVIDGSVCLVIVRLVGHIKPTRGRADVRRKRDDGKVTTVIQRISGILRAAAVGSKKNLGGCLRSIHTGLIRVFPFVFAIIGVSAVVLANFLSALGAIVHRAGGVDHQHGCGRCGGRTGGSRRLDRQRNCILVVVSRGGRDLGQFDTFVFVDDASGTLFVFCPDGAASIRSVLDRRRLLICRQHCCRQQAQRHDKRKQYAQNAFFHITVLPFLSHDIYIKAAVCR